MTIRELLDIFNNVKPNIFLSWNDQRMENYDYPKKEWMSFAPYGMKQITYGIGFEGYFKVFKVRCHCDNKFVACYDSIMGLEIKSLRYNEPKYDESHKCVSVDVEHSVTVNMALESKENVAKLITEGVMKYHQILIDAEKKAIALDFNNGNE